MIVEEKNPLDETVESDGLIQVGRECEYCF